MHGLDAGVEVDDRRVGLGSGTEQTLAFHNQGVVLSDDFIQALVFCLLTMVYVSGACPPPEEAEQN